MAGGTLPAAPETPPRTLDDEALAELAKLEHVREVYPIVRVPMQVKFGDATEFTNATGVPMSSQGQGAFQTIAHGSFFANDTAATCMLSLDMANRLVKEKPEQLVGKELTLNYAATRRGNAGRARRTAVPHRRDRRTRDRADGDGRRGGVGLDDPAGEGAGDQHRDREHAARR